MLAADVALALELVLCLGVFGLQPVAWLRAGPDLSALLGAAGPALAASLVGAVAVTVACLLAARRLECLRRRLRALGGQPASEALDYATVGSMLVVLLVLGLWFVVRFGA